MTHDELISLDDPDKFLNVFLPDGKWLGFFYRRDYAVEFLKKNGHDPDACEISKRRPDHVTFS